MEIAVKSPTSAQFRRAAEHSSFQNFSFQHFSISALPIIPFFPATPFSPPSGLPQPLFQEPSAKSKFLAVMENFLGFKLSN